MKLMERNAAGFKVELHWNEQNGDVVLIGETEQHVNSTVVSPQEALRAFQHPCVYLADSQRFFERTADESSYDDSVEYESEEEMAF